MPREYASAQAFRKALEVRLNKGCVGKKQRRATAEALAAVPETLEPGDPGNWRLYWRRL